MLICDFARNRCSTGLYTSRFHCCNDIIFKNRAYAENINILISACKTFRYYEVVFAIALLRALASTKYILET